MQRVKHLFLCYRLFKSYNRISHSGLLFKLEACGFFGHLLQVVEAMYLDPRQRQNREYGCCEFDLEVGFRHGCPASPILFNIFINDLLSDLYCVEVPGFARYLKGLLFAADTVILAESQEALVSTPFEN